MKDYVGICLYCGQSRIVQVPEGLEREQEDTYAEREASKMCSCMAGAAFRRKEQAMELTEAHIEQLLRKDHPDSADVFQEMKAIVYDGGIKKLTIREGSGGKAEMRRTKNGISVSYEKTNKTELAT